MRITTNLVFGGRRRRASAPSIQSAQVVVGPGPAQVPVRRGWAEAEICSFRVTLATLTTARSGAPHHGLDTAQTETANLLSAIRNLFMRNLACS